MSVLRYRSSTRAEVELVPYRADDAARVAGLLAACHARGRASLATTLARWRIFAARPRVTGNVFLAEEAGELCGLAWLMHEKSRGRESRQFRIVVPPRERRRGVATELLGEIERRGDARSILQCETFPSWGPAGAFLERHGFRARPSLDRMERAVTRGELPAPPPGYRARTSHDGQDRRRWCSLHAQCFARALHYQTQEPADAAQLCAEPGSHLTIVESVAGEFAGYARSSSLDGPCEVGLIVEIAVAREHRRRGLGRYLVRDALTRLANGGARRCQLHVEHDAPAPKQLYLALGFEVSSRMQCWTRQSVKAGR